MKQMRCKRIVAREPTPEQPPVTAPQTGDTSQVITFVLLMMAGVLLCGVAVFGKKSRMTV